MPIHYAPASVTYNVVPESAPIASLHGEPITYAFALPQGATLVSQNGGRAVVRYDAAGTYQITVLVSDTRGNRSEVSTPLLDVLPPKPLTFTMALASADRWNRVPGPVYVRTTITGVPGGDTVAGTRFYVDDEPVGQEIASNAATISLPMPGTYALKAVMRTKEGVTAEAVQIITLILGDNPVCHPVKYGNGTTSLAFGAGCTVQAGVITKYAWEVNGTPNTVSASSLSFPASQIAAVREVKVTATTDKGQTGTAIYNMATGAVTRY